MPHHYNKSKLSNEPEGSGTGDTPFQPGDDGYLTIEPIDKRTGPGKKDKTPLDPVKVTTGEGDLIDERLGDERLGGLKDAFEQWKADLEKKEGCSDSCNLHRIPQLTRDPKNAKKRIKKVGQGGHEDIEEVRNDIARERDKRMEIE